LGEKPRWRGENNEAQIVNGLARLGLVALTEVTLFYSKLPKLPLAKPNTLNWWHLTETKFRGIGK
jgi:hypothetical protein